MPRCDQYDVGPNPAQIRTDFRLRPALLPTEWGWIEPHVQAAIERTNEPTTVEEVRQALVAREAHLFVAPDGFVIWQIDICPRTQARTLWVWLAWGCGHNTIERYQDQLSELARYVDAERVAFRSPRRGYKRALDDSWAPVRVEYERRV